MFVECFCLHIESASGSQHQVLDMVKATVIVSNVILESSEMIPVPLKLAMNFSCEGDMKMTKPPCNDMHTGLFSSHGLNFPDTKIDSLILSRYIIFIRETKFLLRALQCTVIIISTSPNLMYELPDSPSRHWLAIRFSRPFIPEVTAEYVHKSISRLFMFLFSSKKLSWASVQFESRLHTHRYVHPELIMYFLWHTTGFSTHRHYFTTPVMISASKHTNEAPWTAHWQILLLNGEAFACLHKAPYI